MAPALCARYYQQPVHEAPQGPTVVALRGGRCPRWFRGLWVHDWGSKTNVVWEVRGCGVFDWVDGRFSMTIYKCAHMTRWDAIHVAFLWLTCSR